VNTIIDPRLTESKLREGNGMRRRMHSDLFGKTASIGTKFARHCNLGDRGRTDRSKHDDKSSPIQALHEDQYCQARSTGGNVENRDQRGGLKVVDTFTTFDEDKKPKDRLTEKYDDKGRLRSRRRESFDKEGNVVGGTNTIYTYDAEGRMTEEQSNSPRCHKNATH